MRAIFHSTIEAFGAARAAVDRCLLALVALALLSTGVAPVAAETNHLVVRVNDRIATLYDYEQAREQLIEALRRSSLPPDQLQERLADVGVEVMSDLLEEKLLMARGDQIDAQPSRDEVDTAIERAREQAGVQTDQEFVEGLAASGFTPESFRVHLEKNLTMSGVMGQEVRPRIRLSEEDLRRYYQKNLEDFRLPVKLDVREVVVLDSATTDPVNRASIAQDLGERLEAAETADEVIAEFESKGLTTGWIPIGWVAEGDLDPALEAAIWDLEVGEFSAAVPARGGLHLFEILDRQEATIQEFAAVADEIREQETNRRFASEVGDYLAELERDSYVVINPPPEAASFRSVLQRRRDDGLELDERQRALANAGLEVASPEAVSDEGAADAGDGTQR